MSKKFIVPYANEESNVFKRIRRPKLSISIYSRNLDCWIDIENVLADTGADISILPGNLGLLLVGDYRNGDKYKITGLLPGSTTSMYIHKLSVRIAERTIRSYFAISNSNDIPPTLGRVSGLDKFDIRYSRGRNIIINL